MSYTIQAGDTFTSIAASHGTSVAAIEAANPGVNANNLQIGQVIQLPGGGSGGPQQPLQPSGDLPGGSGGTNGGGDYVQYQGPASAFPDPGQTWASYSFLWSFNSDLMRRAGHDNGDQIAQIQSAVEQVARESGIDVRVILCLVMQESGGNVYIPTTNNGVRNPGLLQSHNGVEYDQSNSAASILQMVRDGVEGTRDGPGFVQLYAQYGNYYSMARAYNSGSVNANNLTDPVGATANYVSDLANRLQGHSWASM